MATVKHLANLTSFNSIQGDLTLTGNLYANGLLFQFPTLYGSLGSILSTDGSGHLAWAVPSTSTLTDFSISGASNGQALLYNSGTSKWTNTTLTGASVGLGNVSNLSPSQLFNAPTMAGPVTINGNLIVNGSTTTSGTTTSTSPTFLLNSGEAGAGVTAGTAGVIIDRGTLTNYEFVFVEASQTFRIGLTTGTQAVATREDTPSSGAIPAWNATTLMMDTSIGLTSSIATQLKNIGVLTISAAQWGYLNALNQSLATGQAVSFSTVTHTSASNQIVLQPGGAGNTLTMTAANPATASRTLTIPDPGSGTTPTLLAYSGSTAYTTVSGPYIKDDFTNNILALGFHSATGQSGLRGSWIGVGSGNATGTGADNTALGYNSGNAITTGHDNTLLGSTAGLLLQTGFANTFIGSGAGSTGTSTNYAIAIGFGAVNTSSSTAIIGGPTLGSGAITDLSSGVIDTCSLGSTFPFKSVNLGASNQASFTSKRLTTVAVNAGGTGYQVGDVLGITNTGAVVTNNVQLTVATAPSGIIGSLTITTPGDYVVLPSALTGNALTGGHGTGATANLTFTQCTEQWVVNVPNRASTTITIPDPGSSTQLILGTSTAGQTITGGLTIDSLNFTSIAPQAINTTDLGSTSLPFKSLWLGTSTTDQVQMIVSGSIAASRQYTLPEAGGSATFILSTTKANPSVQTITQGLSINETQYSTGTASQSATTVTGVGTTWTTAMIGGVIVFSGGQRGTILNASATSLTVDTSQTVGSTTYVIYYGGIHSDSTNVLNLTAPSMYMYGTTGINIGLLGGTTTIANSVRMASNGGNVDILYTGAPSGNFTLLNGGGAGSVSICTASAANTINIGNANSTLGVLGTINLGVTGSAAIGIGSTSYSGLISLGNASSTLGILGTINLGVTGSAAIGIGSTSYTGTMSVGNASSTLTALGVLNLGMTGSAAIGIGATSYTGTISIGNNSATSTTIAGPLTWGATGGVTASFGNGVSPTTFNMSGQFNWAVNNAAAGLIFNVGTNSSDTAAKTINIGNHAAGAGKSTLNLDGNINFVSTSVLSFASSLVPSTAGGAALGSASLPFSSLYLGNAATNNAQITGTFAAARVLTVPDPGASTSFILGTSSGGQTISGGLTAGTLTVTGASVAPQTINTTDLGTTSVPFKTLWLGTSSTNQAQVVISGLAASRTYTLPDAGGAANIILSTSGAGQTISGGLTAGTLTVTGANVAPQTINTTDLGTTSVPFKTLWLGTSSTNQAQVVVSGLAASRVYTLPDAGGAATFILSTNPSVQKIANGLSINETLYTTGSASQSLTTVAGVGTTWTTAMIGGVIVFSGGQRGTILAASGTSLTVDTSQSVSSTTYTIYYGGIHSDSTAVYNNATSTTYYTGVLNLNIAGSAATNIGTGTYTGHVTIGNANMGSGNSIFTNSITSPLGTDLSVTCTSGRSLSIGGNVSVNINLAGGTTSILTASSSALNIGTGSYTGTITIGNHAGTLPVVNFDATVNYLNTSVLSFASPLLPSAAGSVALGSSTKPFASMWLGTSSTNAVNINVAAGVAAARTYTLPEVGTDASFVVSNSVNATVQTLMGGYSINEATYVTGTAIQYGSTYNTGTASQTTTTITGSGTTFTNSMVGGMIVFTGGQKATITAFNSATSLTVSTSQSVASTTYTIYYGSGSLILGTGTTWTSAMIGGVIVFSGAQRGTILTVPSATSMTVDTNQAVGDTTYTNYYDGIHSDSSGVFNISETTTYLVGSSGVNIQTIGAGTTSIGNSGSTVTVGSTAFTPAVVNTTSLGSTTLPFKSLILGTATTNVATISGTYGQATSLTVPDPGTSSSVSFLVSQTAGQQSITTTSTSSGVLKIDGTALLNGSKGALEIAAGDITGPVNLALNRSAHTNGFRTSISFDGQDASGTYTNSWQIGTDSGQSSHNDFFFYNGSFVFGLGKIISSSTYNALAVSTNHNTLDDGSGNMIISGTELDLLNASDSAVIVGTAKTNGHVGLFKWKTSVPQLQIDTWANAAPIQIGGSQVILGKAESGTIVQVSTGSGSVLDNSSGNMTLAGTTFKLAPSAVIDTSSAGILTLGSTATTIALLAASTGNINIGNGLNTINIGSQGSTNSVVNIQPGSGNNTTGICAGTYSGTLSIGNANSTTLMAGRMAVNESTYTTGTVGTGGVPSTTVTGAGTTFTSAMAGGVLVAGAVRAHIIAFNSTTSLTVSANVTIANGSSYTIYYNGFYNDSTSSTAAKLQYLGFTNEAYDRRLVLWDTNGGSQFFGLGIASATLVYSVDVSTAFHTFYYGGSGGTKLFQIAGSGVITTGNTRSTLDDGSGNMTLGGTTFKLAPSAVIDTSSAGTLTLGSTASTISALAASSGTVNIGNGLNTINIGSTGSSNSIVNIQNGSGNGSTNIAAGTNNGLITIGNINSSLKLGAPVVSPLAATTTDLGTTSLPFKTLWLGSTVTAADASQIKFQAQRTSAAALQNGDTVGRILNYGFDGSVYQLSGSMTSTVNGTVSSGIVPVQLAISQMRADGTLKNRFTVTGDYTSGPFITGTSLDARETPFDSSAFASLHGTYGSYDATSLAYNYVNDIGFQLYSVAIVGGGTLNQVNDVLTVATPDPNAAVQFQLTVTAVSGGIITGLSVTTQGQTSTQLTGTQTLTNLHSGTAATVTLTYGCTVTSVSVSAQGSGYQTGDIVTVSGGSAVTAAQVQLYVSGGVVLGAYVINHNLYASNTGRPSNPASTTGGHGSGLTLNLTWGASLPFIGGSNNSTFGYSAVRKAYQSIGIFVGSQVQSGPEAIDLATFNTTQVALFQNTGVTLSASGQLGSATPLIIDSAANAACEMVYKASGVSKVTMGFNGTGIVITDNVHSNNWLSQPSGTSGAVSTVHNVLDDGGGYMNISASGTGTPGNAALIVNTIGGGAGSYMSIEYKTAQKAAYGYAATTGIDIYDYVNPGSWLSQNGTTAGYVKTKNNILDDGTTNGNMQSLGGIYSGSYLAVKYNKGLFWNNGGVGATNYFSITSSTSGGLTFTDQISSTNPLTIAPTTGNATFGGGILLPTSGGTPGTLSYYETGTFTLTFTTFPTSSTPTAAVSFVRVGTKVTLSIQGATPVLGGSNAQIYATAAGAVPSRLCPGSGGVKQVIVVENNNTFQIGSFKINNDGSVNVYASAVPGTAFASGTGSYGWDEFGMSFVQGA